jgi:RimJ/RimL family protein N-acetyltransferase
MVSLKPFQKSDYSRLISWVDSAETLLQFAGPAFSFPLTAEQLNDYCSDTARRCFKVLLTDTGQVVGHCEVYFCEKTGWLGRVLIGDTSHRGQGLGRHIVDALLRICFERFECAVVKLNVFYQNKRAIRCYKRCGFTTNPDGAFQRHFGEQLWTGRQMIVSKDTWTQLHSTG